MPLVDQGTDALTLPVGTTAQRPETPSPGMIRVNSTTNKLEVYLTNRWVNFTATP
jgi:hypothetical protein